VVPTGVKALLERGEELFPNLTRAGGGACRLIPKQEPAQVAELFTEFRARGTGASKIENRS
jgi:hypothetical protein